MKQTYFALAVITVLSWLPLKAQTTVAFSFDSAGTPISNNNHVPLPDGSLIQLGYYREATASDLFAGEWVPIFDFTINGMEMEEVPGLFFHAGINITAPVLPGQIMAIRFYDAPTVADSSYYGVVSTAHADGGLLWSGTANPPLGSMFFQIGNYGTTWLNDYEAYTGTLLNENVIPEPATVAAFAAFGVLGFACWHRRYRIAR